MKLSFAIVTPSYKEDFDRCKMLVDSIKQFTNDDVTHYIIVDKKDKEIFNSIKSARIKLIKKEMILPWWIKRLPLTINGKNIWISMKGGIIRGWIIQQIIKIGIANHVNEDVLIYMDSDEFFIKKVNFNKIFVKDGRIRLYRKPGRTESRWDKTISNLLNIEVGKCSNINYVEHPVTWYRINVLKLQKYLEKISDRNWIETIINNWHFSEYQLYGNYVINILKDNSMHYYDDKQLSHKHEWKNGQRPKNLSDDELFDFFNKIKDEHISIMISSSAKIPADRYIKYFNRFLKN